MAIGEVTPGSGRSPSGDASSPSPPPAFPSGRPGRPARPPWREFWRVRRMFGAGVLEGLTFIHREYGPFVRTRLPLQLYFVADPACIEEILVKKADRFRKDRTSRLLSRVVGNGLLVNDGESWRRQRRLLQPAFHQRQLQSYAAAMVGAIERAAATWQTGQVRNVHEDMMAVTLNIVAEALFGADVSADAGHMGRIISELMEEFGRILGLAARFQPPAWFLKPGPQQEVVQVQVVDQPPHAADLDGEGVGRQVTVHVEHRNHGGHKFRCLVIGPAEHFI